MCYYLNSSSRAKGLMLSVGCAWYCWCYLNKTLEFTGINQYSSPACRNWRRSHQRSHTVFGRLQNAKDRYIKTLCINLNSKQFFNYVFSLGRRSFGRPWNRRKEWWNKSNKMQQLRLFFAMPLLYMFRVIIPPIIRSTYAVYGLR